MKDLATIRIVAAYLPCKAYDTLQKEVVDVVACQDEYGTIESYLANTANHYGHPYRGYVLKYQLILTPPAKITDEHLHEISAYAGLHKEGNKITRYTDRILVINDTYELQISNIGYVCMRKNGHLYNLDARPITHRLMELQYDMGYLNTPSLIEAGRAIEFPTPERSVAENA